MKSNRIRIATRRDAAKLLEIYAPYVEKTAVTFEYEVPAVTEFEKRIDHVLEKYPYLVAERAGDISGYAYAGVFKDDGIRAGRHEKNGNGKGTVCSSGKDSLHAEYFEFKCVHCLSL